MLTNEPRGWAVAIRLLLFAAFAVGAVVCVYLISAGSLSDRESAMFGVLTTLLSTFASWLITDLYAGAQYRQAIKDVRDEYRSSLRTYALKAAEKVNNLSKELGRLSGYLEQELQEADYGSPNEELNAKEERIQSAIHIVNTLKSVNDTALSDWQGVIGDEINEQREKAGQREETLRQVVERLAAVEAGQSTEQGAPVSEASALRRDLETIRRDIRTLAGELGAPLLGARRAHADSRTVVDTACPQCQSPIQFTQKARRNSVKGVTCKKCDSDLISEYAEEVGFSIRPRGESSESISCPSCETRGVVALDDWPSGTTTVVCQGCDRTLRISRASGTLRVSTLSLRESGPKLTDEVIDRIRIEMPPQPWPKGIHKDVAERLQMTPKLVQRAIQQLISKGIFQDQIDGQLVSAEERLRLLRAAKKT